MRLEKWKTGVIDVGPWMVSDNDDPLGQSLGEFRKEEDADIFLAAKKRKDMERKPIVLSKNNIALIQIFHKSDELLDISIGVIDRFMEKETVEDAAKQFISQLKDAWTPRFMKALKKEIEDILAADKSIG